mmetsp:Transcript_26579/g.45370  ORF Transcript_26579/g.45370 Transcript_26579/m.45370 type:complete len:114 (-) Transcript_26579:60-401(-)
MYKLPLALSLSLSQELSLTGEFLKDEERSYGIVTKTQCARNESERILGRAEKVPISIFCDCIQRLHTNIHSLLYPSQHGKNLLTFVSFEMKIINLSRTFKCSCLIRALWPTTL